MIKVPNRPKGFQFPLSSATNGLGISELWWIKCQVREKGSFLKASELKSAASDEFIKERHNAMHILQSVCTVLCC